MLKPKKAKLYNPNIVKEISSLCFVRNFKSIPDQDYSFEMTNGLGFDKFLIKAYVLFVGKLKSPVLSTGFSYPSSLSDTPYLRKLSRDLGVDMNSNPEKGMLVLSIKLSTKHSNLLNVLRMYDFINHLYFLSDMKETVVKDINV
jgi:hypothetical protein